MRAIVEALLAENEVLTDRNEAQAERLRRLEHLVRELQRVRATRDRFSRCGRNEVRTTISSTASSARRSSPATRCSSTTPSSAPATSPTAFVVNTAHHVDVGGAAPGSQRVHGVSEAFQEGLRIMPIRLVRCSPTRSCRTTRAASGRSASWPARGRSSIRASRRRAEAAPRSRSASSTPSTARSARCFRNARWALSRTGATPTSAASTPRRGVTS